MFVCFSFFLSLSPRYFEWLKNLSNVRFGRLNRRFDERRGSFIVDALTRNNINLTDEERRAIIQGATEKDLAHRLVALSDREVLLAR